MKKEGEKWGENEGKIGGGGGNLMDLCMGLFFRGAVFVFDHGGVPENPPLALMGRFPSLTFFSELNGPFPRMP